MKPTCRVLFFTKLAFKFLFYFLASDAGQKQIFTGFRGASREGLNFREIKTFVLPLPPHQEQQEICEFLDDKSADINKLEQNLHDQVKTLERYCKSLIHECVAGKRRIIEQNLKET